MGSAGVRGAPVLAGAARICGCLRESAALVLAGAAGMRGRPRTCGAAVPVRGPRARGATAPARPVTSATSRRLWCVTTRSAHPDDETIRPALIDAPGLRPLDNARRLHLLMAAQLDLPTEDLTYWHCLQATAIGPWTAADTHTSTDMLLTAARNDPA